MNMRDLDRARQQADTAHKGKHAFGSGIRAWDKRGLPMPSSVEKALRTNVKDAGNLNG